MKTDWSDITGDEKKKIIESMAGESASQIAAQFINCSRNAIIGFCHRNKIPLGSAANSSAAQQRAARQKPAPDPTTRPKKVKLEPKPVKDDPTKYVVTKVEPTVEEVLFTAPAPRGPDDPVSMNELTSWTCRWPMNHSYLGLSMSEMMFCGKKSLSPEKYCREHTNRAKGSWAKAKDDGDAKKPSARLWRA